MPTLPEALGYTAVSGLPGSPRIYRNFAAPPLRGAITRYTIRMQSAT